MVENFATLVCPQSIVLEVIKSVLKPSGFPVSPTYALEYGTELYAVWQFDCLAESTIRQTMHALTKYIGNVNPFLNVPKNSIGFYYNQWITSKEKRELTEIETIKPFEPSALSGYSETVTLPFGTLSPVKTLDRMFIVVTARVWLALGLWNLFPEQHIAFKSDQYFYIPLSSAFNLFPARSKQWLPTVLPLLENSFKGEFVVYFRPSDWYCVLRFGGIGTLPMSLDISINQLNKTVTGCLPEIVYNTSKEMLAASAAHASLPF